MARKINWPIIHQSASNNPAHDDVEVIRKWHYKERNYSDVGYHYFIKKDGTVQPGRPEEKIGAHCLGHNKDSIGICLSGEGVKTPAQLKALEILLIDLCSRHGLEKSDILAHSDLAPTLCPGFDLKAWLDSLAWQ